MKRISTFLKTSILGGLIVVLPLSLLAILVADAVLTIDDLLHPLVAWIPVDDWLGEVAAQLLAVFALVAVCFAAGVVMRTRVGGAIDRALKRLPGYGILRSLVEAWSGTRGEPQFAAAVVDLTGAGSLSLAFLIEENPDDTATIFVPLAPLMTSGQVHCIPRERLIETGVSATAAMNAITRWGLGAGEIFTTARAGNQQA